jgi:hypothetical protein
VLVVFRKGKRDRCEWTASDANLHVLAWRRGLATPVAGALTSVHGSWLARPEGGELELEAPG